jgi:hypothetical protein
MSSPRLWRIWDRCLPGVGGTKGLPVAFHSIPELPEQLVEGK